jgi:murein L,D-transpeptidase YafK
VCAHLLFLFSRACIFLNTAALRVFTVVVCLTPFLSSPARAAWDAVISEQLAHPTYFVAVDKTRQKLAFFEKQSPLRLTRVFVCTTGQKEGDKEVEGDLKTPEGVYFVVRRIDAGLDFTKFGPRAYTLNYPNPVDRLRGKTGFGIWIHGRGEPLVPLQTEGCIAMNNNDLSVLGKALLPGAPVTLTRSFAFSASEADGDNDLRRLEQKVRDWADAWSGRSRRFFDFYNQEAYSAAQGESFSAFRAQKERMFTLLPWIRTSVKDIRILAGPDYWVTWFHQDYQAPNLSTRGTRRLYWEKTGTDFKIVGMEWEPGLADTPLTASAASLLPPSEQADPLALLDAVWQAPADAPYVTAVAGASGHSAHDAGAREPSSSDGRADLEVPAQAGTQAEAPASTTLPAGTNRRVFYPTAQAALPTTQAALPAAQTAPPADTEHRAASVPDARNPAAQAALSTPDHIEDPAFGPMPRPAEAAFRLAARRVAERERAVRERNAQQPLLLARPPDAAGRPGAAAAGTTTVSAGVEGAAARPVPADESSAMKTAGGSSPTDAPRSAGEKKSAGDPTSADGSSPAGAMKSAGAAGSADIERGGAYAAVPVAAKAAPDNVLVAAAADMPGDARRTARTEPRKAPEARADPLRDAAGAITERIEAWRAAWERGDLAGYTSFYASRARQGERRGTDDIRRHKAALWRKNPPARVRLSDVRVQLHKDRPVAEMRQEYADRAGGGDTGIKTLTFERINGAWLITREEWRGIEAGH